MTFYFIQSNNLWYCPDFGIVIAFKKGQQVVLSRILILAALKTEFRGDWAFDEPKCTGSSDPMWYKAYIEIYHTSGGDEKIAPVQGVLGKDSFESVGTEQVGGHGEKKKTKWSAYFPLQEAILEEHEEGRPKPPSQNICDALADLYRLGLGDTVGRTEIRG
jgi:hypothetical protein